MDLWRNISREMVSERPGGVLLRTLMWILKKAESHAQALNRGVGDLSFISDHLEGLKTGLDLGSSSYEKLTSMLQQ